MVFRFGSFELDPSKGRLFRGQARIALSQPQAALLVQLVSNAGEILSNDALAEAAWQLEPFIAFGKCSGSVCAGTAKSPAATKADGAFGRLLT